MERDSFPDAVSTMNALSKYVGKVGQKMYKCYKGDENNKLLVLNHGDCWNNNMMFKMDPETGKVSEHIFVDLQVL